LNTNQIATTTWTGDKQSLEPSIQPQEP
jgi:hypothetical protein